MSEDEQLCKWLEERRELLLQYYCQQDRLLILLQYLQHQLHTEVGTAMA